ncbi:hypothetical protein KGO5_03095 [Sinorhizobium sp. KGO-5]|uniref:hypothetical protein n=1 Tax=Sinorhizobium sp. KGO-5 TaxID=1470810 RepID=UPI0029492A6C|nr:hypothetical protein KGO5_03095 [Sinorhizobium sp. KGO-5]
MNNVINFPNSAEFEDLSLAERMIIIEQFNADIHVELNRIKDAADKIKELIEANRKQIDRQ